MVAPKTNYCLMPPTAVAIGHSPKDTSFYAITRPELKTISVEAGYDSFRSINCTNCSYMVSDNEINQRLEAEKLAPILPNKIIYCSKNQICNGADALIDICQAGHQLKSYIDVEVTIPYLLWVWDYSTKSKMSWRLYGIQETKVLDGSETTLNIKPYLLANVYIAHPGGICWGKTKVPKDLKEAYYSYWNAPFNRETTPEQVKDLATYVKTYDINNDTMTDYKPFDMTKVQWSWLSKTGHLDGLMHTSDSKIIANFPHKVTQGASELTASIKKTDSSFWMFIVNDYVCLKQGKLTGTSKVKVLYKERPVHEILNEYDVISGSEVNNQSIPEEEQIVTNVSHDFSALSF